MDQDRYENKPSVRPDAGKGDGSPENAKQPGKRKNRNFYDWAQTLGSSLLALLLLFTFFVRFVGVEGHSMVPTLQDGDRLLMISSLLDRSYAYGDIVILRKETFREAPIIKRVIATGGQTVDIDFTTGDVTVDGRVLEEPYTLEPAFREEGITFPLTVPEGSVFVLGDNRNNSTDSRSTTLGTVDSRYILGKAVFLIFPGKDADTERREFSRIGTVV